MRVKTEEKRQEIMDCASRLFLEQGYDAVSMSEISKLLGGSKATLYGYFDSKTEIFMAVIMAKARKLSERARGVLDKNLALPEKLRQYAVEYLAFVLSTEMVDMKRAVYAQAHKDGIGKHVYECGIKQAWTRVADLLEQGMKDGIVKKSDPWMAAQQLKGLLEADVVARRLLGVDTRLNKKALPAHVDLALDVFWAYYKKA